MHFKTRECVFSKAICFAFCLSCCYDHHHHHRGRLRSCFCKMWNTFVRTVKRDVYTRIGGKTDLGHMCSEKKHVLHFHTRRENACLCVCVRVCVCERERETDRQMVCVFPSDVTQMFAAYILRERMCACTCVSVCA